jgi:hypothetical protein
MQARWLGLDGYYFRANDIYEVVASYSKGDNSYLDIIDRHGDITKEWCPMSFELITDEDKKNV